MYQSELFGTTKREIAQEEESKNAIILIQGGYINRLMAGVYSFLPLGWRVMQNIQKIVREEMDKLPFTQEVYLPSLQPREIWEESGRWEEMEEVMYHLDGNKAGLGPTHEEVVTDLFRQYYNSYKDLPLAVYQIQNKFRQETRAKSGLLRGREFLMKDLYSFHLTEAELDAYYLKVQDAYSNIYRRAGIKVVLTEASGGVFSKFSHEYQAVCAAGEDTIYLNEKGDLGRNKEIVPTEEDPELLRFSGGKIHKVSAVEVGNIFKLNRKFSEPMQAEVADEKGEKRAVWMGCFGLGISRLMATMVEVMGEIDPKGGSNSRSLKMIWPAEIAPFKVHLLDLTAKLEAENIYQTLQKRGVEVLYDNRKRTAGEKFADADLIGAPIRLIYSERSKQKGGIEFIDMSKSSNQDLNSQVVSLEELTNSLGLK